MSFPSYMPQHQPMQAPQQPMYSYQPMTTYFPQASQPVPNATPRAGELSGRMVASENDITVNDIPMDGRVHLFILNDYSKVIGKMWTAKGEIATTVFVPLQPDPEPSTQQAPSIDKEWIEAKFDKLENMILESSTNPA